MAKSKKPPFGKLPQQEVMEKDWDVKPTATSQPLDAQLASLAGLSHTENTPEDEEEIIAKAFNLIGIGLERADWQLVSDAYFIVSGERIDPPKHISLPVQKKTKLQSIREKLNNNKSKQTNVSTKFLPEGVQLPSPLAEEIDDDLVQITKVPRKRDSIGAKRFGQDEVEIISTPADPKEVIQNKKENRPNKFMQRKPNIVKEAKSNPNSDIRLKELSETPKGRKDTEE